MDLSPTRTAHHIGREALINIAADHEDTASWEQFVDQALSRTVLNAETYFDIFYTSISPDSLRETIFNLAQETPNEP